MCRIAGSVPLSGRLAVLEAPAGKRRARRQGASPEALATSARPWEFATSALASLQKRPVGLPHDRFARRGTVCGVTTPHSNLQQYLASTHHIHIQAMAPLNAPGSQLAADAKKLLLNGTDSLIDPVIQLVNGSLNPSPLFIATRVDRAQQTTVVVGAACGWSSWATVDPPFRRPGRHPAASTWDGAWWEVRLTVPQEHDWALPLALALREELQHAARSRRVVGLITEMAGDAASVEWWEGLGFRVHHPDVRLRLRSPRSVTPSAELESLSDQRHLVVLPITIGSDGHAYYDVLQPQDAEPLQRRRWWRSRQE
jgi:hypothetical protein